MDPLVVSQIVELQFPELAPATARWLGEGCDSVAFEVNGQWVFRFPKSEDTERQLEIEQCVLPLLSSHLPVAIPNVRFRGEPLPLFSRRFSGYPKLPGEPLIRLESAGVSSDALVEPIASFLSALHALPLDVAARCRVPEQGLDDLIHQIRDDALGDLSRVREVSDDAPVDRWRGYIEAGVHCTRGGRVALIHNDFAAEHILFDVTTQKVTGVIDWSDTAIGDPIADFAGLFHWGGERFARGVLALYTGPIEVSSLESARYIAACRGAMDVAFGLDYSRPEYVVSGLKALQVCAGP